MNPLRRVIAMPFMLANTSRFMNLSGSSIAISKSLVLDVLFGAVRVVRPSMLTVFAADRLVGAERRAQSRQNAGDVRALTRRAVLGRQHARRTTLETRAS